MALTEVDRKLLNRCLAHEPGAWKDFVDRFVGLFVHVIHHTANARSVRVTPADVDDLCSDVFLTLIADDLKVLRHFRSRSSLATYLTVVARRVVVREISRRRMAEAFGHSQAHADSLAMADATNTETDRIENRELVEKMLESLPPVDAEIVRLYHLESKSYSEISDALGVSENTVGPTLSRAREKMRGSAS